MNGYLITDRTGKDNQDTKATYRHRLINSDNLSGCKRSYTRCARGLGQLLLAGILVGLLEQWPVAVASTKTSVYFLSLLGCAMALALCCVNNGSNARITETWKSDLSLSQALFWFSISLFLCHVEDLPAALLIMSLTALCKQSLFDKSLIQHSVIGLYMLGVFTLLATSILGDYGMQLLVLFSLLILTDNLMEQIEHTSNTPLHRTIDRAIFQPCEAQNETPVAQDSTRMLSVIESPAPAQGLPAGPVGIIYWDNNRRLINADIAGWKILSAHSCPDALRGISVDRLLTDQKIIFLTQSKFHQILSEDLSDSLGNTNMIPKAKVICKWLEQERFDRRGKICGGMAYLDDVTELINLVLKIKQHAYFDLLTGLPNRYRLTEEMGRILSTVHRTKSYCALLFIDLDHFKEVNDLWGHNHGDVLLQSFAKRLRKVIRSQETVARLGGDEFIAVLEGLGTCREQAKKQAAQVADKILAAAERDYVIDNKTSRIGCSIGMALFNDASLDSKQLLGQADRALYRIKRSGRCNYVFSESTSPTNTEAYSTGMQLVS